MKESESESVGRFVYPKESIPGHVQTYSGSDGKLYDVYKIIALAESLPEETVSVEALADMVFKNKVWTDASGRRVSAEELFEMIRSHREKNSGVISWEKLQEEQPDLADHFLRMHDVDYTTPILLLGERTVVDGVHRLLKARIDGVSTIMCKRFAVLPAETLLSTELSELGER